jgi:hypothetical protein
MPASSRVGTGRSTWLPLNTWQSTLSIARLAHDSSEAAVEPHPTTSGGCRDVKSVSPQHTSYAATRPRLSLSNHSLEQRSHLVANSRGENSSRPWRSFHRGRPGTDVPPSGIKSRRGRRGKRTRRPPGPEPDGRSPVSPDDPAEVGMKPSSITHAETGTFSVCCRICWELQQAASATFSSSPTLRRWARTRRDGVFDIDSIGLTNLVVAQSRPGPRSSLGTGELRDWCGLIRGRGSRP